MRTDRMEDAGRLKAARMRGEEIGFLMALSPEIKAEIPAFETINEMEAFYGGAYAGYRNETRSPVLTLPDFMVMLGGRG